MRSPISKCARFDRVLVLITIALVLHCGGRPTPAASIDVAVIPSFYSLPLYVAQDQGLFRKHGLTVTLHRAEAGLAPFDQMAAGTADFATVREFAFVRHHLAGHAPPARIIASLASSSAEALVARRDRGIASPADLRHKRIAAPRAGFLHFNLARFLLLHGIEPEDVTLVDVPIERCLDAVVRGDADAAMLTENYEHEAETRFGDVAQIWTERTSLPYHWVLVGAAGALARDPDTSRRLVAALLEAQQMILLEPERAAVIFSRQTSRPPEGLAFARATTSFKLGLDQALLVSMEDQTRWLRAVDAVRTSTMPNYLELVSMSALEAVRPEAITIFR